MRLNDPDVVSREYASEERLEARRSVYDSGEGPDPRVELFRIIAALAPRRLLEVGCGPGELSERLERKLGIDVAAVDLSARMVELARGRGVDAEIADVQELPFGDGEFDCVVAAWMLYHVPDLDRAVAEIRRVLEPDGHLVAVTNSELHLHEARALAGVDMRGRLAFSRENGEEALGQRFAAVERLDVDGWVTFPSHVEVRDYIASMVTMGSRADRVPAFDGPLRARRRVSIFVARK